MDEETPEQSMVPLKAYFEEKLSALERTLTVKMDERDVRYGVMFASRDTAIGAALSAQEKAVSTASAAAEKAVNAALSAAEKSVLSAAQASEKAISKAETAQQGVNERGNEFRKSLDDYTKIMMPRLETDQRFLAINKLLESQGALIEELRRGATRGLGASEERASVRQTSQWVIALVVSAVLGLAGVTIAWLVMSGGKRP
jgi:hypothetical protein